MDAPEISPKQAAAVANEEYTKGLTLLQAKLKLAILEVKNDFLAVINGNGFAKSITNNVFESGVLQPSIINQASVQERGVVLYKASNSKLKITRITEIKIFPTENASNAHIKIYDNGSVYTYQVNLIAGQVNRFPIIHQVSGNYARVLISNIETVSTKITCFIGCDGTKPNDCAYIKGWNGNTEINSEGFGINITFECGCDYEQIMCDLSKTFIAKIIWLKARVLVMEEHLFSTRLTNIVIYGKEEIKNLKEEVKNEYAEMWDNLKSALPNLLKQYEGYCIECKGIKKVTNV